ncbi:MAG: hypothetical protein M1837_001024 [Sclerophora amabilis]|nr:MAG: hypothetical protein M1837_001024 [Sclerophora amabilis]
MASRRLASPALFICDIQEKFRGAIWEYPKLIVTAQKLLKASEILSIPTYATTQNGAKLGAVCSELTPSLNRLNAPIVDKTAFSMWVPGIKSHLDPSPSSSTDGAGSKPHAIAIVGIEAHICVTQTALDLLAAGHRVYVLADGVSSCNPAEVRVALARLRREGVVVTTSESWLYEVMGDASISEFRQIAGLVKETKDSTRDSLETLCKI